MSTDFFEHFVNPYHGKLLSMTNPDIAVDVGIDYQIDEITESGPGELPAFRKSLSRLPW